MFRDRLGSNTDMVPPKILWFVGSSDFVATGDEFLQLFKQHGLQPHHRVLDVGCGIGRMAIPLTSYLDPDGSYEGFDIVDYGIDWCKRRITPLHPQFKFQHADIYNADYNPFGKTKSSSYKFPYDDGEFDFVVLTSVFTHMLQDDVEHYVAEVKRVLKPNGIMFATMFLRNAESARLMDKGSDLAFLHQLTECSWTTTPDKPETAMMFDEDWVLALLRNQGLDAETFYGNWCGRSDFSTYQDVIVACMQPAPSASL